MRDTGRGSSLRLFRTYKDGRAHLNGYLEDHAAVGLGLQALYQVTFDLAHLQAAIDLRVRPRPLPRCAERRLLPDRGRPREARRAAQGLRRQRDPCGQLARCRPAPAPGEAPRPPALRRARACHVQPDGRRHAGAAACVWPLAERAGLPPEPGLRNRGYGRSGCGRHARPAGRGVRRFMPNSVLAAAAPESEAALAIPCCRPATAQRTRNRLRLQELRLQFARDDAGGPGGATRRDSKKRWRDFAARQGSKSPTGSPKTGRVYP
jgi:hypothetical protein